MINSKSIEDALDKFDRKSIMAAHETILELVQFSVVEEYIIAQLGDPDCEDHDHGYHTHPCWH